MRGLRNSCLLIREACTHYSPFPAAGATLPRKCVIRSAMRRVGGWGRREGGMEGGRVICFKLPGLKYPRGEELRVSQRGRRWRVEKKWSCKKARGGLWKGFSRQREWERVSWEETTGNLLLCAVCTFVCVCVGASVGHCLGVKIFSDGGWRRRAGGVNVYTHLADSFLADCHPGACISSNHYNAGWVKV